MRTFDLKKSCTLVAMALFLAFGTCYLGSKAASSDSWKIFYIPSVPASISNQYDRIEVAYYAGGYIANCSSISGENGRQITITADNAGGLTSEVYIITTGNTPVFKTKYAIANTVELVVGARYGYRTSANGTIRINY